MLKIIPPVRGQDRHGSGEFEAPRGSRKHKGIDMHCAQGSLVLSACSGKVTKVGYPYDPSDKKKGHLRYVQVTDDKGRKVRYFYVSPHVKVGDTILTEQVLGVTQGLLGIYKGISDHYHFEVLVGSKPMNPYDFLAEKYNHPLDM